MKLNKNNFQSVVLIMTALGIVATINSLLYEPKIGIAGNSVALLICIVLALNIIFIYLRLIIKRVNPKKHIFISYCYNDDKFAKRLNECLQKKIDKSAVQRFEILSAESISFGDNIMEKVESFFEKSDIIVIVISNSYLTSKACRFELEKISSLNKIVIPVIIEPYNELNDMPKFLLNIKGLEFYDCNKESDFEEKINILAEDLIRRKYN